MTSTSVPLRRVDGEPEEDIERGHARRGRRSFAARANSVVANNVLFHKSQKKEYYEQYTCKPNCKTHLGGPPIFMITISVVQIAIYIYYSVAFGKVNWFDMNPAMMKSPLIFNPYHREQVWRFLTYMFLHGGLYHIVANVVVQLIFGIPLEMVHGSLRLMGIYFVGVIAGSLGSSVFDVGTWLIGASGGDFALMFAFIANIIVNWDSMKRVYAIFRLLFVLSFVITDFAVSVWERYNGTENSTSYAAHIAGAICGLTFGLIILKNFQKQVWEDILFKISIAVFCIIMLAAIIFNIACPCYNPYKNPG